MQGDNLLGEQRGRRLAVLLLAAVLIAQALVGSAAGLMIGPDDEEEDVGDETSQDAEDDTDDTVEDLGEASESTADDSREALGETTDNVEESGDKLAGIAGDLVEGAVDQARDLDGSSDGGDSGGDQDDGDHDGSSSGPGRNSPSGGSGGADGDQGGAEGGSSGDEEQGSSDEDLMRWARSFVDYGEEKEAWARGTANWTEETALYVADRTTADVEKYPETVPESTLELVRSINETVRNFGEDRVECESVGGDRSLGCQPVQTAGETANMTADAADSLVTAFVPYLVRSYGRTIQQHDLGLFVEAVCGSMPGVVCELVAQEAVRTVLEDLYEVEETTDQIVVDATEEAAGQIEEAGDEVGSALGSAVHDAHRTADRALGDVCGTARGEGVEACGTVGDVLASPVNAACGAVGSQETTLETGENVQATSDETEPVEEAPGAGSRAACAAAGMGARLVCDAPGIVENRKGDLRLVPGDHGQELPVNPPDGGGTGAAEKACKEHVNPLADQAAEFLDQDCLPGWAGRDIEGAAGNGRHRAEASFDGELSVVDSVDVRWEGSTSSEMALCSEDVQLTDLLDDGITLPPDVEACDDAIFRLEMYHRFWGSEEDPTEATIRFRVPAECNRPDAALYHQDDSGDWERLPTEAEGTTEDGEFVMFSATTHGFSPFAFGAPTGGNEAPKAAFDVDCGDLTCSFDASGSADADGQITSYGWTFGDGDTAWGRTVQHTFDDPGTYTVTLTVTDDDQAQDARSHDVHPALGSDGPTAAFTVSCEELACTFDASASHDPDGTVSAYEWDLGGSNGASAVKVDHVFAEAGLHEVTLTVTDDSGQTGQEARVLELTVGQSGAGGGLGSDDGPADDRGGDGTGDGTGGEADGSTGWQDRLGDLLVAIGLDTIGLVGLIVAASVATGAGAGAWERRRRSGRRDEPAPE